MNFLVYIVPSFFLFIIGLAGLFYNKKNTLLILLSIELMLLAVSFIFLVASAFLDDLYGQIFVIFIFTVAAAESSIGLAILITYYRVRGTIAIRFLNLLKG